MLLIGVTGGIACGKTEVCKVFQKKGAIVISGDQLGREILREKKGIVRELAKVFGKKILNKNRGLSRRKLGEVAFASKEANRLLNKIIHPFLLRELRRKIKTLRKRYSKGVIVVDAALIVEWGIQKQFDFLVLVDSKRKNQIERFCSSKGYSLNTAREIIRCQLPKKTKKRYADLVIDNDGNLKQLKEKARRVWSIIFALSRKKRMRPKL